MNLVTALLYNSSNLFSQCSLVIIVFIYLFFLNR